MFVEMHNRQSDVSYSFLEMSEEDDEDDITPVLKSSSIMFNQKLSQKNSSQLNSCELIILDMLKALYYSSH
jgi:hypothetical protein